MAELTFFTVTGVISAVDGGRENIDDPELLLAWGSGTITAMIEDGNGIPVGSLVPPQNVHLRPVRFIVKRGRILLPSGQPVRLVANTTVLGLDGDLYYRATFSSLMAAGDEFTQRPIVFKAQTSDTTLDLESVTPVTGSPALGLTRGPGVDNVLRVGTDPDMFQFYSEGHPVGAPLQMAVEVGQPGPPGDPGPPGSSSWNDLTDMPDFIAAGTTQQAARDAIAAQPYDEDLVDIAALTPTDLDILQRRSGAWRNRTMAQLKLDLALASGDVGLGNVNNTSDLNKPISTATQAALNAKQSTSEKGQANGYAGLDSGGKVPVAQLPSSIMEYKGTWNASTNAPTLADGTGDNGDVYRVSVGGTRNLGSGNITFDVGDYAIYNGTTWEKSDTTDAVASVAGLIGAITAPGLRSALSLVVGTDVQAWSAVLDALATKTSPAGQLVGTTDTQTLTGKTISGSSNTLSNIGMAALSATGTPNSGNFLRGDGTWAAPSSIAPDFGTYASRPAPSAAGKIYYCTDIDKVYRDSGAAWQLVSDGVGPIIGEPPTTGWSTNTLGGSTVVADKGGYLFTSSGAGASDTLRCQLRAFASGQTATFRIQPNLPMLNNAGVFITVSDGTKFVTFYWQVSGSGVQFYGCSKFNTATSWDSDYLTAQGGSWAQLMSAQWMRVRDDGTNRKFELSVNGLDWTLFHQHSRTDFLTATQVGWGVNDSVNRAFTARLRQCTVA